MYIIIYNDIIAINKQLEEEKIPLKLHLSDTCGRQSVRIELLNEEIEEKSKEKAKKIIQEYFALKSTKVIFSEKSFEFRLES